MKFENNQAFAHHLDEKDELRPYRGRFYFPEVNGKEALYFCGNSLGLQPKTVKDMIAQELNDWAKYGVEGHFKAKNPWFSYHEQFAGPLSKIIGALPNEVVAMNQLTVNLHLLMVSFYRPSESRKKILFEAKAFPSDQYVLESQVYAHGFKPDECLVEVKPRAGEYLIHHDDIISAIEKAGDELALVMIGGVNYYTGQVFNMKEITAVAHSVGAYAGFDLAHAAGNIEMKLHEWNVDFASWCSYKYLNSGPGGVSGIYIHENHAKNRYLPRFAGWWGYNKETRFKMQSGFDPIPTAEGWQLSNAPVLSMAAHKASIEIFEEAGMENLVNKSKKLTSYLEFIIESINTELPPERQLEIITPRNQIERGCQLSIVAHGYGKEFFNAIAAQGVIADWREPNVIRLAPVPLYNSYTDIYNFGIIIKEILIQNG
jgi:kynureninase